MSNFEKAFAHTLGLEGKYSNNPNDTGGETMGVLQNALRLIATRGVNRYPTNFTPPV